MKKYILPGIIIIVAALAVAGVYYASTQSKDNVNETAKSTAELVTEAFSKKYNKPADAFIIAVNTDTENFARGTVNFKEVPGGGVWFAAKTNNVWELAFDGNGIVPCDAVNKYDFPKDMVPQCIETQNSNKLIQR